MLIRSYRSSLQPDRRRLLESFHYVHIARKVVGVGSVGTRTWILLMMGRNDRDPLFLQVKEAQASVLEPYLSKSVYAEQRQACGRGAMADAGGKRYLPGLGKGAGWIG